MIQKNKWLYVQKVTEGFILFPFRFFGHKESSYSFGEGGEEEQEENNFFYCPLEIPWGRQDHQHLVIKKST